MKNDPAAGRFLAGLEPPEPPEALRARVLSAARQALPNAAPLDIWSRFLRNRPLRIAWAASVLLLLAANVSIPTAERRDEVASRTPAPVQDREIEQIARLPRIDTRLLPSGESPRIPHGSTPPSRKGVLS